MNCNHSKLVFAILVLSYKDAIVILKAIDGAF